MQSAMAFPGAVFFEAFAPFVANAPRWRWTSRSGKGRSDNRDADSARHASCWRNLDHFDFGFWRFGGKESFWNMVVACSCYVSTCEGRHGRFCWRLGGAFGFPAPAPLTFRTSGSDEERCWCPSVWWKAASLLASSSLTLGSLSSLPKKCVTLGDTVPFRSFPGSEGQEAQSRARSRLADDTEELFGSQKTIAYLRQNKDHTLSYGHPAIRSWRMLDPTALRSLIRCKSSSCDSKRRGIGK